MTENVAYSEGLSQCWSGWQMNAPPRDESLAEWVQSVKDMVAERASYKKDLLIWLPARRFNLQVDFENPSWKWNAGEYQSLLWMLPQKCYSGFVQNFFEFYWDSF